MVGAEVVGAGVPAPSTALDALPRLLGVAGSGHGEPCDPLGDRLIEPGWHTLAPCRGEGGEGGDPGAQLMAGTAALCADPLDGPAVDVRQSA